MPREASNDETFAIPNISSGRRTRRALAPVRKKQAAAILDLREMAAFTYAGIAHWQYPFLRFYAFELMESNVFLEPPFPLLAQNKTSL